MWPKIEVISSQPGALYPFISAQLEQNQNVITAKKVKFQFFEDFYREKNKILVFEYEEFKNDALRGQNRMFKPIMSELYFEIKWAIDMQEKNN